MLIPYRLESPPPLPPLDDPWETPDVPLDCGRRVREGGDRAVFNEGPTLDRLAVLGPLELLDRRLVALEESLFVWEVETEGPVQLLAEVEFAAERVRYERAEDGSRLWLAGDEPADELLVSCYGGTVEVREEGARLLLHAQGRDRVRLVVVGAWSEEDRERTLRSLARKGVAGVVAQQVRHVEMIERLGVKIITPDRDVDEPGQGEKHELDSYLEERRDGHRMLIDPYEHGRALLVLGLREPVRDTLRAPLDDPERRRLFARYGMWAGVDEFVRRHWARLMQEVRSAERKYRTFQLDEDRALHLISAAELIPLAEALGDRAAMEALEEVGVGVEPDVEPEIAPEVVLHDVDEDEDVEGGEWEPDLGRWGLVPNALEGILTLTPKLPPEWPEMTIERLRVGDSSLDVRVRRRASGVSVTVRVTRGPQVVVHLAPVLPWSPTGILVGDDQLPGPSVRMTVTDEVEALWIR